MTDAEFQSKLAERDDVIRQLVARLRESVDEVDRLKAELARREGASAYDVLVDIMRNSDLPAAIRTKAASAVLPHEKPKLMPEKPLDLTAEGPPEPLADVVHRQRKRAEAMWCERRNIRVLPSGQVLLLDGNGDASDDAPFG